MAIKEEAVGRHQIAAEGVEVSGGDLLGRTAVLADQVPMDRTGQVVHGGALAEVRVNDDTELFELIEEAIDGRRAHLRGEYLHGGRQFVGAAVPFGGDENLR